MHNISPFALAALAAVLSTAQAQEPAPPENAMLDRDFREMMAMFPGRYDNQEQVYFEQELGVPEEDRHERTHHIFHPVTLENFPGETFYIQQYQNNDPSDIYRQRIYSFEPDYDENAIRLNIYTPKNPEGIVDAHLDESKLKGLSPEDMITRPGCEVYWKREAAQFTGYMKEGACTFKSSTSGKTIVINDDLHLSEDAIWISDRATDIDGNYVFGNRAGVPHKNQRAQMFSCWVSVRKKSGDNEWSFDQGLELHDQGGWIWVTTDERRPQKVGLKMRNVVWPTGYNRDSLVLYAYREDSKRAESYVWTSPDADRIAMNLRWVQASCTRDKD